MYPDLVQAIDGAAKILATALSRPEKVIHNYILVPFKDPGSPNATTAYSTISLFQKMYQKYYLYAIKHCKV